MWGVNGMDNIKFDDDLMDNLADGLDDLDDFVDGLDELEEDDIDTGGLEQKVDGLEEEESVDTGELEHEVGLTEPESHDKLLDLDGLSLGSEEGLDSVEGISDLETTVEGLDEANMSAEELAERYGIDLDKLEDKKDDGEEEYKLDLDYSKSAEELAAEYGIDLDKLGKETATIESLHEDRTESIGGLESVGTLGTLEEYEDEGGMSLTDSSAEVVNTEDFKGKAEDFEEEVILDDKVSANFIDDNGEIVVMDNRNPKLNFGFSYVSIDNIAVPSSRVRKAPKIESLLKSVQSTGLLSPIVIAPTATEGLYVLIDGLRRLIACARAGLKEIPAIINNKVSTPDIPVVEALYNHHKKYSIKEIVDYIDYLENEKGVMTANMIEYLLQLNSGDYTKLKDILNDNDEEIVEKLLSEQMTIEQAFKKLESRRKKETADEKEEKQTEKVYSESKEDLKQIEDSGEVADEEAVLTDEEIKGMMIKPSDLEDVDDESLDDLVAEGKNMEGFEPHKQNPNEREIIDPAIRKAVMSRDKDTCQCCHRGGPDYVDILDLHHIVEVYLGGVDSVENGLAVCLCCHKQIHLYAFGRLHIPESKTEAQLESEVEAKIAAENTLRKEKGQPELTDKEKEELRDAHVVIYKEEQNKYKRIIKLGNIIREGMQKKGMKLEQAKKEHPIDKIGRQKPGVKNTIA